MSLPQLYNVPSDDNSWHQFSFNNAANHSAIYQAILNQRGLGLQVFILDPIPFSDTVTWLETHQEAHNQQNLVLGINGTDLTDVDFTDQKQLAEWIWLHANEHQQAGAILGVI